MGIAVFTLAFALAALCAACMGYAIQRGATCTVAAVDEITTQRSHRRLASLLEASLWVAGGLLVAQSLHMLPGMPAGCEQRRCRASRRSTRGTGRSSHQSWRCCSATFA